MAKWNERSDIESWSEEDDVSERDDDTESFTYQSWTRKSGKAAVILTKNQKEFTSTWKVAVILLKKNVYLKRIQKRRPSLLISLYYFVSALKGAKTAKINWHKNTFNNLTVALHWSLQIIMLIFVIILNLLHGFPRKLSILKKLTWTMYDICRDFGGISFSAGGLGAKAPGNSKGYNSDLRKIIFSFKYIWMPLLEIMYGEKI